MGHLVKSQPALQIVASSRYTKAAVGSCTVHMDPEVDSVGRLLYLV